MIIDSSGEYRNPIRLKCEHIVWAHFFCLGDKLIKSYKYPVMEPQGVTGTPLNQYFKDFSVCLSGQFNFFNLIILNIMTMLKNCVSNALKMLCSTLHQ